MTGFLIDTNVTSEVLRPLPDAQVAAWSQLISKEHLYLSVVSFGEIRKGITIMPVGARRSQLETAIDGLIPSWFAGRILPVNLAIAERWGVLEGQRQLMGRPLHVPDAQLVRLLNFPRKVGSRRSRHQLQAPRSENRTGPLRQACRKAHFQALTVSALTCLPLTNPGI